MKSGTLLFATHHAHPVMHNTSYLVFMTSKGCIMHTSTRPEWREKFTHYIALQCACVCACAIYGVYAGGGSLSSLFRFTSRDIGELLAYYVLHKLFQYRHIWYSYQRFLQQEFASLLSYKSLVPFEVSWLVTLCPFWLNSTSPVNLYTVTRLKTRRQPCLHWKAWPRERKRKYSWFVHARCYHNYRCQMWIREQRHCMLFPELWFVVQQSWLTMSCSCLQGK